MDSAALIILSDSSGLARRGSMAIDGSLWICNRNALGSGLIWVVCVSLSVFGVLSVISVSLRGIFSSRTGQLGDDARVVSFVECLDDF